MKKTLIAVVLAMVAAPATAHAATPTITVGTSSCYAVIEYPDPSSFSIQPTYPFVVVPYGPGPSMNIHCPVPPPV